MDHKDLRKKHAHTHTHTHTIRLTPPPSSTGGFSTSFFVFCDAHFLGGASAKISSSFLLSSPPPFDGAKISSPAELLALEDPVAAKMSSGGLLKRLSSVFVFLPPEGLLANKSSTAAVVFLAGAGLEEVDGGALEGGENRLSPPNRSA